MYEKQFFASSFDDLYYRNLFANDRGRFNSTG
ncbi:MAG: hypothetical protein ACI9CU_002653, partial [Polaribacter sp.]